MRFEFLKKHQKEFDIKKACKALKISRSGFYAYLERKPCKRHFENQALCDEIEIIFKEHQGRYGCVRIQKELANRGILVNHKRVSKLMRKLGLIAKGARKHYKAYSEKNDHEEKANLLNQLFVATKPNKVWLGDITYIPTKTGTLYLAVFIDLYSRKIVGWSMNKHMKESLVVDAFLQACGREHPSKGLIVHSDQGSQYTGKTFRAIVEQYGGVLSNSRKGNPYDNAIMESFYRTLKRELINDSNYDNREQAQQDIFKYIEIYYNTKRIHSALGYLTPVQFERNYKIP